eukprot:CAMPEP_0168613368 /NCGR_PEP_ID=MMETSP0449_2-20121227/3414_1 /TAXON_ID=1082188 /ORGANISM="Strombidium rassoulzadegani, Strain ras09" /LENGTH=169 /DNA_ID=CAMNT_0008653997 /DNA_START=54 /DNA_END=563 /DNA_ORIENTATION=-
MASVAVAKSASSDIKIDLFNTKHFNFKTENLVSSLLKSVSFISANELGKVSYSQCDDDAGVFILDTSSTSNSPDPVTKGNSLTFDLQGIVTDNLHLTNLHVHVIWNDSPLYDEDHPQDATFDSSFEQTFKWDVPSFAPSGNYDVTFTGTGDAASVSGGNVLCVKANMEL